MAMAAADAATYITTGANKAIGQREDLIDKIARIDPTECPFYQGSNKAGAEAIYHEWQVQELVAPAKNAQPEGFKAAYVNLKPTLRLGNYCQIASTDWSVSRSLNVVNKAGRAREITYQQLLKGLEIRRDIEVSLTGKTGVQIKKGTDPRELASFPAWAGNFNGGATGTPPVGDGTTAGTAGTPRAVTLAILGTAMQSAFDNGGKPELIMVSSAQKRAISALINVAGTATSEYRISEVKPTALIGAVSAWQSDFGELQIVPNRFMPAGYAFGIQPGFYTVATLPESNFVVDELAKIGDADNGMVTWEGTLRVDAPKAHFVIADLS